VLIQFFEVINYEECIKARPKLKKVGLFIFLDSTIARGGFLWYGAFEYQQWYSLIKTIIKTTYMNQFILIINGPVCAGKTSVIDAIMGKYKKVFRLSQNKIKWLISDYTPDRDREAVQGSLILVADKMLEHGLSLILEGGSVTQGKMNEELEKIGAKHGLKATFINIEAPLEVLKARFQERLKVSAERGTKVSFTDDEGYMQRYNAYLAIKGDATVMDSNTMTPEEIGEKIMTLV